MKKKCFYFPLFVLSFICIFFLGCASKRNPWSEMTTPTTGDAEVFGSYSAGCVQGATALQPSGPGYHVMRISRKRFYGHPMLIDYIEELGLQMQKRKLGTLLISDLGQARGGPMLYGHSSHQTGLDVDIWYWQPPEQQRYLNLDERENLKAPSVLSADEQNLNGNWNSKKIQILKTAAEHESVDRIFVHSVIKRELCDKFKNDPQNERWLKKIRPWWAHHDHFHVRLSCPLSSAHCKPTEAIPPGNGCDETLAWWFSDEAKKMMQERKKEPEGLTKMPELPMDCQNILENKK